jgi:hypothetical protein
MNRKKFILFVLTLLVLTAFFLVLDFHLIRGQFNIERVISTASFGRDGELTIDYEQEMDFYVLGAPRFENVFSSAISSQLSANQFIGEIKTKQNEPAPAKDSILIIRFEDQRLFWTPVFSSNTIKVKVYYSTDGDVSWIDDDVIRSKAGPYTIWLLGTLDIQDRSCGLMSLPGYHRYLGQQLGKDIAQSLENSLNMAQD